MATIISVASGKGGVGKSVVAGNLAVLLARRGKRVILADLDVGGADLHILFGLFHPLLTLTDFLSRRVDSLEAVAQPLEICPGLRLIVGTGETLATANMPYAKKKRLIRRLKEVDADLVVVDVGAGTSYHALDFFLMADRQLAVATPDPTSVLDLYRFIKLAAIRRVLSAFLARDAMSDALSDRDFSSVEEVLEVAGKTDAAGRALVEEALKSFRPCLILNRVSGRSRVNTLQLRKLLQKYVGGDLTVLGDVPDDEAVERSVRSFLPVVDQAPESPAAAAFNRIADALMLQLNEPAAPQPI
ncbi:MAG: P-loop NTPase [Nitrospirae bacterium]|nr:P-loop NTPase [Nitrospirota bacterium]